MSFQKLSRQEGKVEILLHLTGNDLIGTLLNAPLSIYKQVYVLPMMHIDPEKVLKTINDDDNNNNNYKIV